MSLPALDPKFLSLVAVDEGLDRLIRLCPDQPGCEWTLPLKTKCRSLQVLPDGRLLVVTDQGWMEVLLRDGSVVRNRSLFPGGVISAQRLPGGETFCAGLNLMREHSVCFVVLDHDDKVAREVSFPGDYVRRSTLTEEDTILFTCDSRVLEGDWSGGVRREFSLPGFRHAWKAVRLADGRTMISAGYGAFVAEFDQTGRVIRRWDCREQVEAIRPFFFGDFEPLEDGGLLVCNWLGHGTDLGGTGCCLLHLDARSRVAGAWQEPVRTSSLQTFVRC